MSHDTPTTHGDQCDWHCDQYPWECNCGTTRPRTAMYIEAERRAAKANLEAARKRCDYWRRQKPDSQV